MSVLIKDSKITGKGVFADRDFKKGETVLKWDLSNQLLKKEVEKLSNEERVYISFINGKYTIMQEPEKYVNHSCDSNTYAKDFQDIAKRDIGRGEEITSDYSDCEVPGFKMECKCGSKNCKRVIRIL